MKIGDAVKVGDSPYFTLGGGKVGLPLSYSGAIGEIEDVADHDGDVLVSFSARRLTSQRISSECLTLVSDEMYELKTCLHEWDEETRCLLDEGHEGWHMGLGSSWL